MKNKVKIAVVGIGLMGSQHLKAIKNSKKAILHSIVDINERSRSHAKKFNVPFYKNSSALLKNNKPTIPSTLEDELKNNIFLRSDKKNIKTNLNIDSSSSLVTFSKLRDLKDNF